MSSTPNNNLNSNHTNDEEDDSEVPIWIDNDFFIEVLQNFEKQKDIKIKNLELKSAAPKTDHFASIMFRVIIDYYVRSDLKHISLILKTLTEIDGFEKEVFEVTQIFETEIRMYASEIPKIEAILRAAGDATVLGPTVIYHGLSPKKFIIFEDLVPLGYTTLNGMASMEIIKAAYKKLAKLHAVSFKLIKEQPENFEIYRHCLINSFQDAAVFKNGILYFIEMLGKHKDLIKYKTYFEALHRDNLQARAVAACEEFWKTPEIDAYYVLCHGDFHDKNFMLKFNTETGKLDDLMLLDYQFSYVGPIGNDLIYSIYTILSSEQWANNLDELLYFYFTQFLETLQRIGFEGPMPKLMNFLHQMERQKSLSVFLFTHFMPVWYAARKGAFNPGNCEKSKDYHAAIFDNPDFLRDVRQLLPKYLYQGYLEID